MYIVIICLIANLITVLEEVVRLIMRCEAGFDFQAVGFIITVYPSTCINGYLKSQFLGFIVRADPHFLVRSWVALTQTSTITLI